MNENDELNLTEELNKIASEYENRENKDTELKPEDLITTDKREGRKENIGVREYEPVNTKSLKVVKQDKSDKKGSNKSSMRSKGMDRIKANHSQGSTKREYSPQEFDVLDSKGQKIVEILKEEGKIQDYPPIRHSPTFEPRNITYSPNYREAPRSARRAISPEMELQNDSVHIPKNMNTSPFKENNEINESSYQDAKHQTAQMPKIQYEQYPNFQIPDPITFPQQPYPRQQPYQATYNPQPYDCHPQADPFSYSYGRQPSIQLPMQPQYPLQPSLYELTQKVVAYEWLLPQLYHQISQLQADNGQLHAQLTQKRKQFNKYEYGVNQERKDEYQLNVTLQKANKYHKKVVAQVEKENATLRDQLNQMTTHINQLQDKEHQIMFK